jgi:hypothetical protein
LHPLVHFYIWSLFLVVFSSYLTTTEEIIC